APVPPGAVVVPVRLADPAVTAMLRPGDRIDVVRAGDAGHEMVAQRALVLQAEAPTAAGGGPLGLGGEGRPGMTLVAVSPAEGRALAAAGTHGALGALIVDG